MRFQKDRGRNLGSQLGPTWIAVFLVASLVGCGGIAVISDKLGPAGDANLDDQDSGSYSEAGCDLCTPSTFAFPAPGTYTGPSSLKVFIHISATATGQNANAVPVTLEVQAAQNAVAISNATVLAGPLGRETAATSEPGRYVVQTTGWAPWWGVSFESAAGSLTGVRLHSPSFHSASFSSQPVAHQPAHVTWTPNHENAVDDVEVMVFDWSTQQVIFDQHVDDSGKADLPATVINPGSTLDVQVRRFSSLTLAVPDSAAILDLTAVTEGIVP